MPKKWDTPEEYEHNRGQEDAKSGKYGEPNFWSTSEQSIAENQSYRAGHAHTSGQLDGAENRYNPPSDSDAKEAYDEAWERSHNDSKGGGCFISTACLHAVGLPDDCDELETLRLFRDGYLLTLPDGKRDVEEYYSVAPTILGNMATSPSYHAELRELYQTLVLPSVTLIRNGEEKAAHELFRDFINQLKSRWV